MGSRQLVLRITLSATALCGFGRDLVAAPPHVVPDAAGRTAAEAKQAVEAAGLSARFQVGRAAPSEAARFRVYDSLPPAEAQVAPRTEVLLTIYSGNVAAVGDTPTTKPAPSAESVTSAGELKPAKPFWIGVYSLGLSSAERAAQKISDVPGVVVVGVYPQSPADEAGLRRGDVITSIDDRPMTTAAGLAAYFATRTSPTKPVLHYVRGGNRLSAELDPIMPPDDIFAAVLQAAEAGAAWAQYETARLLQTGGGGVPRDSAQARVWLTKSAAQGLDAAEYVLGRMYLEGVGGDRNLAEACRLLGLAADAGNAEAQYQLGVVYFEGLDDVPADATAALERLHQAAAAGHGRARMYLGGAFERADPPDHARALRWFQQAADSGTVEAYAKIALLYFHGWGVPQSHEVAFVYYLKGAEAGDRDAQFVVGTLCRSGVGTHVDEVAARRWFQLAANSGEPRAQNELGLMFQTGDGVPPDPAAAEQWFRKAADAGNPLAEFNLAFAAERNDRPTEAFEWYRKAAQHGIAEAEFRLGKLYAEGRGVKPDAAQAELWYRRALQQGHKQAQEAVRQLSSVPADDAAKKNQETRK